MEDGEEAHNGRGAGALRQLFVCLPTGGGDRTICASFFGPSQRLARCQVPRRHVLVFAGGAPTSEQ